MYTTCVIWLAFVPLYYGTGSNVALRITSMSVTISLSASVTVVCLFSPKVKLDILKYLKMLALKTNVIECSIIATLEVSDALTHHKCRQIKSNLNYYNCDIFRNFRTLKIYSCLIFLKIYNMSDEEMAFQFCFAAKNRIKFLTCYDIE